MRVEINLDTNLYRCEQVLKVSLFTIGADENKKRYESSGTASYDKKELISLIQFLVNSCLKQYEIEQNEQNTR